MSTNVVCDLCHEEVGHDDSFVVADAPVVKAFHYKCGRVIEDRMYRSLEPNANRRPVEVSADWRTRELEERVAAAEEQVRKVTSVWRLWLNDARKGAINPGTFDAMRSLLGMDNHE